jgi:hypothetical protein
MTHINSRGNPHPRKSALLGENIKLKVAALEQLY